MPIISAQMRIGEEISRASVANRYEKWEYESGMRIRCEYPKTIRTTILIMAVESRFIA